MAKLAPIQVELLDAVDRGNLAAVLAWLDDLGLGYTLTRADVDPLLAVALPHDMAGRLVGDGSGVTFPFERLISVDTLVPHLASLPVAAGS